ncbi:hypothetical protein DPMN_060196 [Dreissena polymorpha]|uniref:Uncharacterized protein n=1 Tax=Dreissena polymorpha TaxID=45954 RepID=A0A9D4HFN1_DREPO|nr:hypothetical protein DPMN_060196 [Dreissena polymorpha]
MEGSDEVTSATKSDVTEVNSTLIKAKRVVESAAMEGCDRVHSTALDFLKETRI